MEPKRKKDWYAFYHELDEALRESGLKSRIWDIVKERKSRMQRTHLGEMPIPTMIALTELLTGKQVPQFEEEEEKPVVKPKRIWYMGCLRCKEETNDVQYQTTNLTLMQTHLMDSHEVREEGLKNNKRYELSRESIIYYIDDEHEFEYLFTATKVYDNDKCLETDGWLI